MSIRRSVFVGLAALLLPLSGCTCGAKIGDPRPADELAAYRPTDPDAVIDAVKLGTNTEDKITGATIGTSLPATADRAIVWYRWDDAKEGHHVQIRWSMDGEQILEQEEKLDTPFGDSAWVLKTPTGSPLPAGSYKVELVENGTVVSTIPFTVGP